MISNLIVTTEVFVEISGIETSRNIFGFLGNCVQWWKKNWVLNVVQTWSGNSRGGSSSQLYLNLCKAYANIQAHIHSLPNLAGAMT